MEGALDIDSKENRGDEEKEEECCVEGGGGKSSSSSSSSSNENRREIDWSAPFESVKEAVTRFGGGSSGWKSGEKKPLSVEDKLQKVAEETAKLKEDLIAKEKETLGVLKDLDSTKRAGHELKLKLHKEASRSPNVQKPQIGVNMHVLPLPGSHMPSLKKVESFPILPPLLLNVQNNAVNRILSSPILSSGSSTELDWSPGAILMQLRQAKVNLKKANDSFATIRCDIKLHQTKTATENAALTQTKDRLNSKYEKISSMQNELKLIEAKLQQLKHADLARFNDREFISKALQQLGCEAERYKKAAEAAKSDAALTRQVIEQTKDAIRTKEIRLHAAKKMEEASRAAEASLLIEYEALQKSANPELVSTGAKNCNYVSLSLEEYCSLYGRAKTAENEANNKIKAAMLKIDEANASRSMVLRKVEKASEEAKVFREGLRKALVRVETSTNAKFAAEDSLRRWRGSHAKHRRSVRGTMKSKNLCSVHNRHQQCRCSSGMLDVNGTNLVEGDSKRTLRSSMSIGEILNRKLMSLDDFEIEFECGQPKVSLAQMLSTKPCSGLSQRKSVEEVSQEKQVSVKGKKFGFRRLSMILVKKRKNKKKSSQI